MAFSLRSLRGPRNSRERQEGCIVSAALSSTSRDRPSAALTASAAEGIAIAERHFASTSSLATSEMEAIQRPEERNRIEVRRISFEDDLEAASDRDRINDLRDPDAVLDLSDDVFGTPTGGTETRQQQEGAGASKMRNVSSQNSDPKACEEEGKG